MTERWLPVVGFEKHYDVSDFGRVRSIVTNFGNPRQRLLKPSPSTGGYLRVALSMGRKYTKKPVAHLVLEAFVGPRPAGMEACHDNGVNTQNDLGNLRWGTPKSNYEDRSNHGKQKGENCYRASIDEATAKSIKVDAADRTLLARDIAAKYGTTIAVVRNIRNNRSWAWL